MTFSISRWDNTLLNRPCGNFGSMDEVKAYVRSELDRLHYRGTEIWEITTPQGTFMGVWPNKHCDKLQFPRFHIQELK